MNFADYRIVENDNVLCEPCLSFTFFSVADIGATQPPDILVPYRVFKSDYGEQVSYCITDGDQMHAKKITDAEMDKPVHWFSDEKRRAVSPMVVQLRAGANRDEWRAPCLACRHDKGYAQRTFYRICIPLLEYGRMGLEGVLDYLKRNLSGFPVSQGYVGYSFAWNYLNQRAEDATAPYFNHWLQRHPGIVSPDALSQHKVSHATFLDIGWITLLGREYCGSLGGISNLRAQLEHIPNVTVDEVEGSVLIRVGEAPRLGDARTGDMLEDYQAVGRVLNPIRKSELLHRCILVHGLFDKNSDAAQAKWIDRFFPA